MSIMTWMLLVHAQAETGKSRALVGHGFRVEGSKWQARL